MSVLIKKKVSLSLKTIIRSEVYCAKAEEEKSNKREKLGIKVRGEGRCCSYFATEPESRRKFQ